MRRAWLLPAVVALLALAPPAAAQSVKLPAEVKAQKGMIFVTAETDSTEVLWYSMDPGLQVAPGEWAKDSRKALCLALEPGTYRLQAIVAKGDKAAFAITSVVVVGPGPGPGPAPIPVPPGPVPPPADPFARAIQAAYDQDREPERANRKADLAALYRMTADSLEKGTAPEKTVDALFKTMQEARRRLMPDGAITHTRTAIQAELDKILPTAVGAPLGPDTTALCASQFRRVAASLEAAK